MFYCKSLAMKFLVKELHSIDSFFLSAPQTIPVSGGTTLSVLCCMVCRHRKKWHHLVVQRGATSGTKWYHVAPRGTTLASSGATVVPPLHRWLHNMLKSGTTVAPWCCHVAPRGANRLHHQVVPLF